MEEQEREVGEVTAIWNGSVLDVKTLATLPTSLPCAHSPPAWSRKFFICAAILPNRVGTPKMIAS